MKCLFLNTNLTHNTIIQKLNEVKNIRRFGRPKKKQTPKQQQNNKNRNNNKKTFPPPSKNQNPEKYLKSSC